MIDDKEYSNKFFDVDIRNRLEKQKELKKLLNEFRPDVVLLDRLSGVAGEIINTRDNTMKMCVEGEDIVFDLILTKSGHYILLRDTFNEKMVKRGPATHGLGSPGAS